MYWFSTSKNQIEIFFFDFYILKTKTFGLTAKNELNQLFRLVGYLELSYTLRRWPHEMRPRGT